MKFCYPIKVEMPRVSRTHRQHCESVVKFCVVDVAAAEVGASIAGASTSVVVAIVAVVVGIVIIVAVGMAKKKAEYLHSREACWTRPHFSCKFLWEVEVFGMPDGLSFWLQALKIILSCYENQSL